MPISTSRRLALALAIAAPLGAMNMAARSVAAESDAVFEDHFAHYEVVPEAVDPAADGAVDMAAIDPVIEPTHQSVTNLGSGVASYYGMKFNGRPTASGEPFDMTAMTAAHRTLPFGSKVRVTNARTGKSVVVRINDRGPFHGGRVLDVSRAAAKELGLIGRGKATVELALLDD